LCTTAGIIAPRPDGGPARAFGLTQLAQSPLLPVFAVHARGTPRLQVDIGPALPVPARSSHEPPAGAVAAFARRFEALARSHPGQLFAYEPVFAADASRPLADGLANGG